VAVARFPLRRETPRIRGRERLYNVSMTRFLRARAPRGKRAYGKVPPNRGKNTTLIAAITLEGGIWASL
jgi:hypothetical protein